MAISGNLRVSTIITSHCPLPFRSSLCLKKVDILSFLHGGASASCNMTMDRRFTCNISRRDGPSSGRQYKQSPNSINEETDSFLLTAINMTFFDRLNLVWRLIFPSSPSKKSSNATIAKKRLKMILFSDRCAVSDEAKRKIVHNIVRVLSEFVEVESQDKVELSVSTDSDIGTIYSVTVPVRRVKPEYQDREEIERIRNVNYKDIGESSGSVGRRFDFW